MTAAPLLERLHRVIRCGQDRWRAICPAHESKHHTQSLAIRELADGTVLLKCFAGCGAADVVAAVGMELRDLFPPQSEPRGPMRPKHWHAVREAVHTLQRECLICALAADNIARGVELTRDDIDRVALVAGRIRNALEACV